MDDRWLSLAEIADYLGVSRDTVYRWLELRHMPAHKVGRQWKFKAAEARYTSADQIVEKDLKRWLRKASAIQWDYKNIVKRKGKLERLK